MVPNGSSEMNFKNFQDLHMLLYVFYKKYSSSSFLLIRSPNEIGRIFQKSYHSTQIDLVLFLYILMTSMTNQYLVLKMLIVAYQ